MSGTDNQDQQDQLSRRHLLVAAGAAAAWLSGESASAHELSGRWKVKIQWPERTLSEVIWTLNGNGTFTSSDGFNGAWTRRGSLVLLAVHGGNSPSYAGNLSGQSITGVALERNGRRAFWSADLQP